MTTSARPATFLFTDLENSTPLWEAFPGLMQQLSPAHDALLKSAIEAHKGQVVKTTGDGFHAIFDSALDGVAAALVGQQAILGHPWPEETGPLQVRMGLHSGESQERDGDYYGVDVNRAARVMGIAHGGQVLLSGATAALIQHRLPEGISLLDLGQHRLRGLASEETIFQLQHPALPTGFPPLKSLSVLKHNLPVQLSSFVGREKEMADVKRFLEETRLLTLLGPGGTGKTRLMLETAEELTGRFPDGVWLVELASLADPDLLPEAVAAALAVQEQPGRKLTESIVDFLRRKDLLLLLDNIEHLVQASAQLAEHLLSSCPRLRLMVTGREALFIPGEITLQIPSLTLPALTGRDGAEEIRDSESVQLFLARAQEVRPGFALTQENGTVIADLVRRLDGIPFALELAAARLRMFSVEQISERLNDRFRLLTGGRRTALPRQQTLAAMIDWSWNLLNETERRLLQRLSVFSGGWSLRAAQAVASDESLASYDLVDALEQLVNKSLVTVTEPARGETRYGLLESIRQYGRDKLFESNEGERWRERHAAYFVDFAEEAGGHRTKPTMLLWVDRIRLELDNLRAAMAWSLDNRPELAVRISGNLLYREAYWLTPRESQAWLEPAIQTSRPLLAQESGAGLVAVFINALQGLAFTFIIQGHPARGLPFVAESVQLARERGNLRQLIFGIALKQMSNIHTMTDEDMRELEEAVAIGREQSLEAELAFALRVFSGAQFLRQGDPALGMAYLQEALQVTESADISNEDMGFFDVRGQLAEMQGNWEEAKAHRRRAIERYTALNHRRSIAVHQSGLAHVLRREGSLEEAEAAYRATIVGWQEIGQLPAVAHQLECFAYLAMAGGDHERAARLLGAATSARLELDATIQDQRERQDLDDALSQLAAVMGEAARDEAMGQGGRLSLDDAVQLALRELP